MSEGIAECQFYETIAEGRALGLGRNFESEVINQLAINPQCQGVHVYRQNHSDYDGKDNFFKNLDELKAPKAEFYWDLWLEYNLGHKVHWWRMLPRQIGRHPGKTRAEGRAVSVRGLRSESRHPSHFRRAG